jgi:hypothetical protein
VAREDNGDVFFTDSTYLTDPMPPLNIHRSPFASLLKTDL